MDLSEKSINYLKSLTAETVSNASSGHTGSALGASSIMFALFKDHLRFDKTGKWISRDRFVLSAGHLSSLLYSSLYMFGYDISINDLKQFRKYGSKTPGHPEYSNVGVETTTGPLGQGVSNAVGLAMAEAKLSAKFGEKFISNYTYCLAGDGCLMEGVALEACALAGALKLNKLILLYDSNGITIDGSTSLASSENIAKKFEAMGWNIIKENNGNNYECCSKAIEKAKTSDKPTIIIFKTTIGIGTKKEGTAGAHAYPLSTEELAEFKNKIGIAESFYVPDDVLKYCQASTTANNKLMQKWKDNLENIKNKKPETYKEFNSYFKTKAINFAKILQDLDAKGQMAGRSASGIILNEISKFIPSFFGGTADLSPSTKAYINDGGDFSAENRLGQNIHFGIREHAMAGAINGISLYFKTPAFDSTFLAFSNYMMPALRLRAMMNLPALSVLTHDSINIGEDGPTHQPIEQLGQLRLIPNLTVIRPASNAELIAGYKYFVEKQKPTALIVTKSTLASFYNSTIFGAERGAYIIFETKKKADIQIFASGTEVELAVNIAKKLDSVGARVISVPCESIFAMQDDAYKKSVLLKSPALSVAIEASNDNVWYKYIGTNGLLINVNNYQTSGKGSEVYKKAGFNEDDIIKKIKASLKK